MTFYDGNSKSQDRVLLASCTSYSLSFRSIWLPAQTFIWLFMILLMVLPPWDNNYVVYGGWHASWLVGLLLRHQFSGAIPSKKRVFFGKKKSCHWKKLLYLLILKADKSTKFTSMGETSERVWSIKYFFCRIYPFGSKSAVLVAIHSDISGIRHIAV